MTFLTQVSVTKEVAMRHGHAMTSFQVSIDCIWLIVIGGVANQSDLLTSSNSVMVFELGKKL